MQTNTFQGVIVTDTFRTYYVFTYVCGDMEWSGQGTETAIVGYNSNGDYFKNHEANGLADINEIISCIDSTNGGETDQLPLSMNIEQIRIQGCMALAAADDADINDIGTFLDLDQLPACPSTKVQLFISTEYQVFPQQTGDCYRSKFEINGQSPSKSYNFASVCCYAPNG